jgi:hypothetical protein
MHLAEEQGGKEGQQRTFRPVIGEGAAEQQQPLRPLRRLVAIDDVTADMQPGLVLEPQPLLQCNDRIGVDAPHAPGDGAALELLRRARR